MASYVGIPNGNPLKYTGPNVAIVSIVVRNRAPTGADIRQGTTGQYYPIGSLWIVSKDPTTGSEGDMWWLGKIVANVAYWQQFDSGIEDMIGIHTPDGTTVLPTDGIINFLNGSGMNITGSGSNITFNSVGGGLQWNAVAGTSQALVAGNAYVPQNVALTTFSLPVTAAFGDFFVISGVGSGGWTISQAAGQSVIVGNQTSTIGVGGSVSSTLQSDSIQIVCVVANTTFKAVDWTGNITVV